MESGTNGTVEASKGKGRKKKPATPRTPTPKPPRILARFKLGMTVALGVGIPLLSLAMSRLGGSLAIGEVYLLSLLAFGLMLAVLGVSLSHLAWAIGNITRSAARPSWALAIALDLSLVLCELVHVYAASLGLAWVCFAVMAAVALTSMLLNVYAFLMHD